MPGTAERCNPSSNYISWWYVCTSSSARASSRPSTSQKHHAHGWILVAPTKDAVTNIDTTIAMIQHSMPRQASSNDNTDIPIGPITQAGMLLYMQVCHATFGRPARAKSKGKEQGNRRYFFSIPHSLPCLSPYPLTSFGYLNVRVKGDAASPKLSHRPSTASRLGFSFPQYQQRQLNSSIASLLFASQLQNNAIQCALTRLTRLIPPKPCPLRHMRGPARCEALAEVLTGSQATFSCGWLISLA